MCPITYLFISYSFFEAFASVQCNWSSSWADLNQFDSVNLSGGASAPVSQAIAAGSAPVLSATWFWAGQ